MKTKHILAVLSTCLIAVSFSPINFFSQAAPPPGFTIFDGKEFQFDVSSATTNIAPNAWTLAFTCPPGRTMKITNAVMSEWDANSSVSMERCYIRVNRASNGDEVAALWTPDSSFNHYERHLLLSPGDAVEYYVSLSGYASASVTITGVLN